MPNAHLHRYHSHHTSSYHNHHSQHLRIHHPLHPRSLGTHGNDNCFHMYCFSLSLSYLNYYLPVWYWSRCFPHRSDSCYWNSSLLICHSTLRLRQISISLPQAPRFSRTILFTPFAHFSLLYHTLLHLYTFFKEKNLRTQNISQTVFLRNCAGSRQKFQKNPVQRKYLYGILHLF